LESYKGYIGCKKKAFKVNKFSQVEKGLQSRSATAHKSLLIKNYQCMKEEVKLIVFLAQKSRNIVEACERKQGSISPSERDHVWMQ